MRIFGHFRIRLHNPVCLGNEFFNRIGLKLTLKGRRKGQELKWVDLISGEAALAVALNASVGNFGSAAKVAASSAPATSGKRALVRAAANPKRRRNHA
jgi:hypothetical protein